MKIKYLGHSCFMITSDTGARIITDPYETAADLTYAKITESADIVTVSHGHFDHRNAPAIRGNPKVVKQAAAVNIKGIAIKGIPSYHDDASGTKRGNNIIFCIDVDGIRVCHLGDLGHRLSDKQIAELGKVDILFIPVGGYYTIDARGATEVGNQIKPKAMIPMHFKTEKDFPDISGVEPFLKGKTNVTQLDTSEAEFGRGQLPTTTQIIVLKPAL